LWYGCPEFSYVMNENGNITLLGLGMGQGIEYINHQFFCCPEEVCDLSSLEGLYLHGSWYEPNIASIRRFNFNQSKRFHSYEYSSF